MERVRSRGFTPINVDVIVHAEAPKLTPHKRRMGDSIAELIGVDAANVSVKAKTNEGVGPEGRGEAISAQAVALIETG